MSRQVSPYPAPAKKSLGQHFLVDRRVLGRIVRAAEISPDELVVEIGPGRGVLTRELADRAARVVAVELDESLAATLTAQFDDNPDITVLAADARDVDIDSLVPPGEPYKVVANLPYYAASPIIRRFLSADHKPQLMVVMVQREVAQSMAAEPGKMRLVSVAVQVYGKPRIIATVPPKAFRPSPAVSSAVVRIDVYPTPAIEFEKEDDFFTLVRAGFSSPRKQIHNCMRHGLSVSAEVAQSMLSQAGIDPKRRAQTLSLKDWSGLYKVYQRLVPAST